MRSASDHRMHKSLLENWAEAAGRDVRDLPAAHPGCRGRNGSCNRMGVGFSAMPGACERLPARHETYGRRHKIQGIPQGFRP